MLFILIASGCYKFYVEIQPKHAVMEESYSNTDTTFVMSNYFLCSMNGRYYRAEETNKYLEDSMMTIIQNSFNDLGITLKMNEGVNLITSEFCEYNKKFKVDKFIDHVDSIIKNNEFYNDDSLIYLIPFISLNDICINTSFNTGNVYVNRFSGGVTIILIKNKKIIYLKYFHGLGVSDNKERVTDDWPNCPDPPEVLYEQAHWDTLVGLAMEDYMKRLNVEKR